MIASSSSDFSRSFKKRYGVPPSAIDLPTIREGQRAQLEASIEGARGIVLNISGGSELGLLEVDRGATDVDANHAAGTQHVTHFAVLQREEHAFEEVIEIVVVTHREDLEQVRQLARSSAALSRVSRVVEGGAERVDSVRAGALAAGDGKPLVYLSRVGVDPDYHKEQQCAEIELIADAA